MSVLRLSTGELRLSLSDFKGRLSQLTDETSDTLRKIWLEAGYEEIECQGLLGDFMNKLKAICLNELAAERQILEHAKQHVTTRYNFLRECHTKLGRDFRESEESMGSNITDKLAELEKRIAEISVEVNERQSLLDAEGKVITELVNSLGSEAPSKSMFEGPPGTPALSDTCLKLMKEYKRNLQLMAKKREEEIRASAFEAYQLLTDLVVQEEGFENTPRSSYFNSCDAKTLQFGKSGGTVYTFSLHSTELEMLKERVESLVIEKEKRREELAAAGAEIARLWTLLRIPTADREAFQSSFKMNMSIETLSKGREELVRLRTLRSTSLSKVVCSIREEISGFWEELGVNTTEQQREEFKNFFTPTEDLEDSEVDIHEEYLTSLKVRVEELRPMLQKIARREAVVLERIELEHLQQNPERLTARGPKAREDRKREESMTNRVKSLEKTTKEVLQQIAVWEEKNGDFLYGGQRYSDRVDEQEECYREIRDSLRNARKKKDGKPESSYLATKPTGRKTSSGVNGKSSLCSSKELSQLDTSLSSIHISSDLENLAMSERNSTGSECTEYTSATVVRDRESTATSATVVKGST